MIMFYEKYQFYIFVKIKTKPWKIKKKEKFSKNPKLQNLEIIMLYLIVRISSKYSILSQVLITDLQSSVFFIKIISHYKKIKE
jgi:hypothetical protein